MIEAIAYRYRGHSMSDPDRTRPEDEKARWRARDPLMTFERVLLGEGLVTAEDLAGIRAANQATVDDAVEFAIDSPSPPRRRSPTTSTRTPGTTTRAATRGCPGGPREHRDLGPDRSHTARR